MIIKGKAAGNVGWWANHLQREDTNDRAQLMETRGLLSEDLTGALREMQAVASGSRSHGNFMYQANINPRDDEHLTPEQWRDAVDTLEKKLGFEGHQRIVVEHEKEGRTHRHVVWNRVDVDTMKVADITNDYQAHNATARELEERFNLGRTPSAFERRPDGERVGERSNARELWEIRAAERSGIDPKEIKAELTQLWRSTDSGKAFAAALEDQGYKLARGDRRDFVVVDHAGDAHSLARRIDGAKAQDVRERMADIDRAALPGVAEARAQQRAQHGGRESAYAASQLRRDKAALIPEPAPQAEQTTSRDVAPAARPAREIEAPQERSPLQVAGKIGGAVSSLADFVGNVLSGDAFKQPEKQQSPSAQILERRRAAAALDGMRVSMEKGERLRPEDIQNLTPTHLENIRAKGDAYVRQMIDQHERDRARANDWSRGRER